MSHFGVHFCQEIFISPDKQISSKKSQSQIHQPLKKNKSTPVEQIIRRI
jgi:hypothetical protein